MTDDTSSQAAHFLTITENEDGQRLDNYLLTKLKGAPRTLIYRIVRTGEVRVNKGRIKPEYRLQIGDIVRVPPLRLSEEAEPATPSPQLSQSYRPYFVPRTRHYCHEQTHRFGGSWW
jgi:23S rRNA pseudouridine955/2504/2580 synthase